jgi:hypothetical protein
MVHSGGFEPPTARFVAEYSIQLSYECIFLKTSAIYAVSRGAYTSDLRGKRQVNFATKGYLFNHD